MVKPSWAVMKFTVEAGPRPSWLKMSGEPAIRVARVWTPPMEPRQKSRKKLRNWSFHSLHRGPQLPTW